MMNFSPNLTTVLIARYYVACPLCHKSRGQVTIDEDLRGQMTLDCKQCGRLGQVTDVTLDWSVPGGVSHREHGRGIGELLTVWLSDNPPDVVDRLASVARQHES